MSAKEARTQLGIDIVGSMSDNDEFPMADIFKLAGKMMEYYSAEGFDERWAEYEYKWLPSESYWRLHLKDVREGLRRKNRFLEFIRDNGTFNGKWKFVRKPEFEALMNRERKGIEKRTETYNNRLDEANKKWKLKIPSIRMGFLPFDELND